MIRFVDVIVAGSLGDLPECATTDDVIAFLGSPEIHESARKSYPEMLVYGDLEFHARAGQIQEAFISLAGDAFQIRGTAKFEEVPPREERTLARILALLSEAEVGFAMHAIMSDEDQTVIITTNHVHLAFYEDVLTRIGIDFSTT